MDEAELSCILKATLSSEDHLRVPAERALQSLFGTPGFLEALAKIVFMGTEFKVSQMASIHIKNLTQVWAQLPLQDRDFAKQHLLSLLSYSVPEKFRSQFEVAARNIISIEGVWPELRTSLEQGMSSEDAAVFFSCINCSLQVCRVFEMSMQEDRAKLQDFTEHFFPALAKLLTQLLQSGTVDAFHFIEMILHTYWVASCFEITSDFVSSLPCWVPQLQVLISMESCPYEKAQFRAAQIATRLLQRGTSGLEMNDSIIAQGKLFVETYAMSLLDTVLHKLATPCNEALLIELIKYAIQSFKLPGGPQKLTEAVSMMLPLAEKCLLRKQAETEKWSDNPEEFLQNENDFGNPVFSLRYTAVSLISEFCQVGYLQVILHSIVTSAPDVLHKEAHLFLLGSINTQLKPFANDIQVYLQASALPELTSSVGLMRYRALWLIGKLAKLPFDSAYKTDVTQKVCSALSDPELPVRVQAAITLPKLEWPEARSIVTSYIQQVLQAYIGLMGEISIEELADALSELVEPQLEHLSGYAVELVTMLSNYFNELVKADPSEDEGEAAMTALAVVSTLGKLLDCASDNAALYNQLINLYLPIMEFCLKNEDYLSEGLDFLCLLIEYAPQGHEYLANYLTLIGRAVCGDETTEAYAFSCIYSVVEPIETMIEVYGCARLDMGTVVNILKKLIDEDDRQARKAAAALIKAVKSAEDVPEGLVAQLEAVKLEVEASSDEEAIEGGGFDDPEYLKLLAKVKAGKDTNLY